MAQDKAQDIVVYIVRFDLDGVGGLGEFMSESPMEFPYPADNPNANVWKFMVFLAQGYGFIEIADIEQSRFSVDSDGNKVKVTAHFEYRRDAYRNMVCDCDLEGYEDELFTLDSFGNPIFAGWGINYCPNCGKQVSIYDSRYFMNTMEYTDTPVYLPESGNIYKRWELIDEDSDGEEEEED